MDNYPPSVNELVESHSKSGIPSPLLLDEVRKELFKKIVESPLFDTKSFSNDFCKALDDMLMQTNENYK